MSQFKLQLIAIIQFGIQRQRLLMDQRRLRVHKRQIEKTPLLPTELFTLPAAHRFLRQHQRHTVAGK
ncbi:hypothetical protein D3C79_1040040 [compost metagenome]